jgi:hypothetical protein
METQFRSISSPSPSRYPAIINRCIYYDYGKTTVLVENSVGRPIRRSHVIFTNSEVTATQPYDDHITDERTYFSVKLSTIRKPYLYSSLNLLFPGLELETIKAF